MILPYIHDAVTAFVTIYTSFYVINQLISYWPRHGSDVTGEVQLTEDL